MWCVSAQVENGNVQVMWRKVPRRIARFLPHFVGCGSSLQFPEKTRQRNLEDRRVPDGWWGHGARPRQDDDSMAPRKRDLRQLTGAARNQNRRWQRRHAYRGRARAVRCMDQRQPAHSLSLARRETERDRSRGGISQSLDASKS
jgi:hypothetical protein